MARRDGGRPARKKRWFREIQVDTEIAAGASAALLELTGTELEAKGFDPATFTVLRIRADLLLTADVSTAAANERLYVGVGIQVMPDALAGADILPLTNPDSGDWMYWRLIPTVMGPSVAGDGSTGLGTRHIEIDVKAMRRSRGESRVVLVVENSATSGFAARVIGGWSVLVSQ